MEELKKLLCYDGKISYGKGRVTLSLPVDIHNWIMLKVGSKWRRGSFIIEKLRIMMEGKFIISDTVLIQKPRTPTLTDRREDIEAQTRNLKQKIQSERRKKTLASLTPEEKEEWMRQEKLEQYHLKKASSTLDLATEMKEHFANRKNRKEKK